METLMNLWHDVRRISRRYGIDWLTAGLVAMVTAGILVSICYANTLIRKKYAKQ